MAGAGDERGGERERRARAGATGGGDGRGRWAWAAGAYHKQPERDDAPELEASPRWISSTASPGEPNEGADDMVEPGPRSSWQRLEVRQGFRDLETS